MIPDEAVEAAAQAIYESESYQNRWDWPVAEFDREEYRKHARAALESAAPHMLAAALEDREEVEARVKSIVQDVAMTVDYTDHLYAAVQKIMAVTRG